MDYHVTLDAQFGLSAFDFIMTWNATAQCRAAALARTSPSTPVRFDLNLISGTSVVLSGVDREADAAAVCGLIRLVLEKRDIRQALETIQTQLPDGGKGVSVKAAGFSTPTR
ncbi:MAG: hypothetical protein ABSH32_07055 [Bryobacteraceae bacterium]|jgi:hypothetical protein